jgi:hypothetical protein
MTSFMLQWENCVTAAALFYAKIVKKAEHLPRLIHILALYINQ